MQGAPLKCTDLTYSFMAPSPTRPLTCPAPPSCPTLPRVQAGLLVRQLMQAVGFFNFVEEYSLHDDPYSWYRQGCSTFACQGRHGQQQQLATARACTRGQGWPKVASPDTRGWDAAWRVLAEGGLA